MSFLCYALMVLLHMIIELMSRMFIHRICIKIFYIALKVYLSRNKIILKK